MKSAVRTMGYARSGAALAEAAEKGLKYGRKTGEIVQDEEKRFLLGVELKMDETGPAQAGKQGDK